MSVIRLAFLLLKSIFRGGNKTRRCKTINDNPCSTENSIYLSRFNNTVKSVRRSTGKIIFTRKFVLFMFSVHVPRVINY